jgi:hypothetical protein
MNIRVSIYNTYPSELQGRETNGGGLTLTPALSHKGRESCR